MKPRNDQWNAEKLFFHRAPSSLKINEHVKITHPPNPDLNRLDGLHCAYFL